MSDVEPKTPARPAVSRRRRSAGLARPVQLAFVALIVLGILSVGGPMIEGYTNRAKIIRARREVRTIGMIVQIFLADMSLGRKPLESPEGAPLNLMVSSGQVPEAANVDALGWLRAAESPDVAPFEDYLLDNVCGFPKSEGGRPGWNGPYLNTAPMADPWGNRYACNVGVLRDGFVPIVVSAGPDGRISLPYFVDLTRAHRRTEGDFDDIVYILQ